MLRTPDKRARRQPKQERAQRTVDAIVEAAARVIAEEGIEKANTNRIAEVAGVGIGSLYEYFADKEGLTHAVLERCARRKLERMMQDVPRFAEGSAADAIEGIIRLYIDLVAEQCDLTRALLGRVEYKPLDEEPDEIITGFAELVRGQLLLRREELRPLPDIEMTVMLLVNTINATVAGAVLDKPEYLRDPLFPRELSALVSRYVLPT